MSTKRYSFFDTIVSKEKRLLYMTKVILEQLTNIEDLALFSNAFKKGKIQVNITKIAKHLGKDRKTIRRYLKGEIPKKTYS